MLRQNIKRVIFLFSNIALCAGLSERITKLEKEMQDMGIQNAQGTFGPEMHKGQPEVNGSGWYTTGELLYWNVKLGGTEYVFTSGGSATILEPPLKGRVKYNSFGWNWGGRFGIGKKLCYDGWDLYLNFTYYQNHHTESSTKSPPAFLISQVGFFGGLFEQAKANNDITYLNLDLELGRKYFVSRSLALRPSIGLKGARLFQEQKVKLDFSPLGLDGIAVGEYYRVYNRCDVDGIGPKLGLQGSWVLGYGFRFESEMTGALLYSFFDAVEKEKASPHVSPINTNIRLKGKTHLFVPFAQLFGGLCWESYLQEKDYYITLKLGYEVLYFWRENQCISPDDWNFTSSGGSTRLQYERFSEDLSFYGITFKFRFDF